MLTPQPDSRIRWSVRICYHGAYSRFMSTEILHEYPSLGELAQHWEDAVLSTGGSINGLGCAPAPVGRLAHAISLYLPSKLPLHLPTHPYM